MIRDVSQSGTGCALVDLNGVGHFFAVAMPRVGGDFVRQVRDALEAVRAAVPNGDADGEVVRQTVFLADADRRAACMDIVADFYGEQLPATTYLVQRPCDDVPLVVEAWGVVPGTSDVEIERPSPDLVIERHHGIAWAHCANIRATASANVYDRSLDAFGQMRDVLAGHGFRYDQVARTWLYLGDIVGPEGATQRYKELNRARTDFYKDIRFLERHVPGTPDRTVYPASTGIGASDRDVLMECVAVATERDDVVLAPLENPQQTAAFDYSARYGAKSPKFCRAMAVVTGETSAILVSGTASIVASETRFVGDAAGQTRQTLSNIEALISRANFRQHNVPGLGATLDDLALVRVYVKRPDDYEAVKAICRERLVDVPTLYTIADVCRPDLLVELEGVAFCGNRADAV